jgi:hypothetical protein
MATEMGKNVLDPSGVNELAPYIYFLYGSTALYGPGPPRFVEVFTITHI